MTCERYWRDGIVLVERGLEDPHRDGCDDCARAHASRQELIDALPLIGASYKGDPQWRAKVWRRIDGERTGTLWRWRWQLAGALTAACVVALWIGLGRIRTSEVRPAVSSPARYRPPDIETIHGGVAMRSIAPVVGDRLRFKVGATSDVWIYRADHLELLCRAGQVSDHCTPDAYGMVVVDMVLSASGMYHVITTAVPVAPPRGSLDDACAPLIAANIIFDDQRVMVR